MYASNINKRTSVFAGIFVEEQSDLPVIDHVLIAFLF